MGFCGLLKEQIAAAWRTVEATDDVQSREYWTWRARDLERYLTDACG